jgi:hypothetical protein
MIRFSVFVLISVIIFSCGSNPSFRSNLDFSGVDEFWKITSILVQDIEPDENDWNALFNTPGYSILTESEFSKDYFKNYFRLAYMPNKKDMLREELGKPHWRVQYLRHMTTVLSQKEEKETKRARSKPKYKSRKPKKQR